MSLKERLRNSPWLINWKYTLVYFTFGTALIMYFLIDNQINGHNRPDVINITLPIFTFILYFVRIAGDKLSDDFIIKKYNHLPFLVSFIIISVGIMLACVLLFVYQNARLALTFALTIALIVAAIHHIWQPYKRATSLISFGIIILFFGLMQYSIVAMALQNYGGSSLWILATSAFASIAFIVAGALVKVRFAQPQATLEALNLRLEKYLNRLFKGLPMVENLLILKEQLKVSFTLYIEEHFTPDVNEEKLFYRALDNFGNFAPILYPYRKNILARLAGTNNKVANFIFTFVLQAALTLLYVTTLNDERWGGILDLLSSISLMLSVICAITFVLLSLTRLVMNFKNKNHLITPSLVGLIIFMVLIVTYITATSFIDSFNNTIASTILIVIMSAVVVASAAVQTFIILRKRGKRLKN